ncbi:MAG: 3-dehydroquinate synthase [Candidatus Palauibacterales bacterium]|nr:3-dehydroquinate synthase [Candidatus Palauibacterales bacterium]
MSGEGTDPAEGEGLLVPVPDTGAGGYRVEVRPGALDDLGPRCRRAVGAHRYAVVADERVADHYAERALRSLEGAGQPAELFTFPEGEASKSRERWGRLTDRMLEAGLSRDAAVVALGGGVTGDLAGFVAATYMRGVPVVQVPTSLLAMLDSSVGGKTGVNTPAGKNLVGAFHHPEHVLVDPEVLATLDRRHLRAGLAEAVKAAAIADGELFAWMEERAGALAAGEIGPTTELVRRAVAIKADVVARDPEEAGRRQILNFGHTLGHALESTAGLSGLHGEAVAAGMVLEARRGEETGVTRPGTADRLRSLLEACGIPPWPLERHDPREVLEAARRDKKAREGGVRLVLLENIGNVSRADGRAWTHPVDEDRLLSWLPRALRSEQPSTD